MLKRIFKTFQKISKNIYTKMPPKLKKTYTKKQNEPLSCLSNNEKETEYEKQNKGLNEKYKQDLKPENANSFDKSFASPLKKNLNFKPLGFWSQKLKNLESENSFQKSKKHGLYEFSATETDESGSPYKRKKKIKQKRGPKKKKQPVVTNKLENPKTTRLVKKIKQIHSQSLFKEQFILKKEREKLADTGKKFTFSTGMQSLGITSTPAVNRDNLVGASNFLFLSPIKNEECANDNAQNSKTPQELKFPDALVKFETPKLAEKKISCRRVLRNGKIL